MTDVNALSCSLPCDSTLVQPLGASAKHLPCDSTLAQPLGAAATQASGMWDQSLKGTSKLVDQSLKGTSKLVGISGLSLMDSDAKVAADTTLAATAPVKDVLLGTSSSGTMKEAASVLQAAAILPSENSSLSRTTRTVVLDETAPSARPSSNGGRASVAPPLSEDLYDSYNSFPEGRQLKRVIAGYSDTALSESSWMAASGAGEIPLDYSVSRSVHVVHDVGTIPAALVSNADYLEGSLSISHSLDSTKSLTDALKFTTEQSKQDQPSQAFPAVDKQKLEAFSSALHGADRKSVV